MTWWLLWVALGCSSSPKETSCEGLDESTCSATPKCLPVDAAPTACVDGEVVRNEQVYAGCFSWAALDTAVCDEVGGVCWRPSAPDELFDFPTMCIPEGWECEISLEACDL